MRHLFLLACFYASLSFAFDNQTLSDPTKPVYYKAKNQSSVSIDKGKTQSVAVKKNKPLILKSILISPVRNVAVINNQSVVVGDVINDAKVINIKARQVTLVRDDDVITLHLLVLNVKKNSHM